VVRLAPWTDSREAFKQRLQESVLRQVLDHLPGLAPLVDYVELSTPLSTDLFCRPLAGSIYGLAATPERFTHPGLRPRTPVRGLYFSGSDLTSGGVIGAFGGGVLAALAMQPRRVFKLLRSL